METRNLKFGILSVCSYLSFELLSQNIERPNILWLTYEDTSPQFIGCYGNEGAHTKAMDALANKPGGLRFNSAFSNSTVSSPSRSCIITGVDVNVLGTNNHRYARTIPNSIKAFPYYLRKAGYYTSNNVKTDYNISNPSFISETWNESSSKAHWRKRLSSDQPFFSVFNIMYSHQSYVSRNEYSYYLAQVYNKLDNSRITKDEDAIVPDFYKYSDETKMLMARVQNCINYTDQLIEERLEELRKDGLDDNTIVFIFADHGEGIPRGKTCAIGMGYRVPFIVWFPEKWRHLNPYNTSIVTERQICFEDLAPTILHLSGVEIPTYMKGRPIFDKTQEGEKYIHGSRNRIDDSPGIDRSVIKGKYIYTRMFSPYLPIVRTQGYAYNSDILLSIRRELNDGGLTESQAANYYPSEQEYLYDIEADKWEMNNLAKKPEYANLLKELRTEMVNYAKSIKDIGFMPEFEMRRRSIDKTPMELREDYDINIILDAAMLVGDKDVLSKQVDLLSDKDPLVRYWASVGIYTQGEAAIKVKELIIERYKNEIFESAKLKLAAFLYKYCGYNEAKQTIETYCKCSDNLLANEAVLMIQDMGDKIFDFKLIIDEIKPIWQKNDDNYCVSPATNVTQLIIRDALQSPFSAKILCGQNLSFQNVLTGGLIGIKDENIVCQTFKNENSKLWKLEDKGNGYFAIINSVSDLYLAMENRGENGIRPKLTKFSGADEQLWNLCQYRNGFFLKNKATGKPIQVNGQSKEEGAIISQWAWNGNQQFVWKLVLSEESSVSATHEDNKFGVKDVTLVDGFLSMNIETSSIGDIEARIFDVNGHCLSHNIIDNVTIGDWKYSIALTDLDFSKTLILEARQKTAKGSYSSIMKFIAR
ncbi:MAG: sulfatase-like hydrolase/transferase [Muribaculaceae bacterium]